MKTSIYRLCCLRPSIGPIVATLLVFGLLGSFETAWALKMQSLSLVKHFRFYVGGDKAFIGDPYDWSGVGRTVQQVSGGVEWGGRWATMISPSYFVSANHQHPYDGSTVRFFYTNDPNGAYEDRVVLSGVKVGSADLWLGKLSAPVSSSVAKYPILRLAANADYTHLPVSIIGRPTDDNAAPNAQTKMHMGFNWINAEPTGSTYYWGSSPTSSNNALYAEGGDSGGPSFIISDGVPTALGIHWYPTMGSFIPDHISAINAAMTGGEQATVQNTYVAPPPVVPPTPPSPASERWNVDSAGSWADPTKWLSGAHYPYATGNIATFDFNLTTTRNVTLISPDPAITVGGIVFNDADATGQNGLSSSGYAVVLDGNNLTLDTGTPGYDAADLVVIDMPATNKVGHRFTNTTGKLVMTDDVQFNVNSGSGVELNLGSGLLSGTRKVIKTGNSQLLMAGDNSTYSGNLRVQEGLVQARSHSRAFGFGTVTLTNGSSNAMGATVGFNNYGTAPMIANAYVWEQTAGVTSNFNPFYVIGTDVTWSGAISSVNAAAGDGASLSVNAYLSPYGQTSITTNLTGNNTGLKFDAGKGFITSDYLGVGNANALGAGNAAYVQISSGSYAQAGVLATAAVAIASKIDVTNNNNVASAVIGGKIVSGTASYSGLITLNSNNSTYLRQMLFRSESNGKVVFDAGSVIGNGGSNGSAAPITKIGSGRVEFNGANSYLGTTAVRSGELVLGNANALGAGSNATIVSLGDATTTLAPVRVATKGNDAYGTYTAGTVTGAATSIDGITLAANDRVLVKDNMTAWKNGVYVVQGTTSTWVRDTALDSMAEAVHGVQVTVTSGTVNTGKTFFLTQSSTAFDSSGLDWQTGVLNPTASLLNNGVTISRKIDVVANGSTGKSILGGSNTTGTAVFSGDVTLYRDLTVTAAGGGSVDFSGAMTGGYGVTKEGLGTVVFSTNKTYAAATTVAAGILAVNGTLASSGVTVNAGATLQGVGGIPNGVVVGGTLAPGNSIGSLAVGSASFTPGSVLAVEVDGGAGTADQLSVGGNLDLTNAALDLTVVAPLTSPAYVIAGYGTLTGTFAGVTGLPAGYVLDYGYNGGTQIALVSSYSTWTAGFGAGFTDTAPGADPDGDGLTNQQEYAFGTDPTATSPVLQYAGTFVGGGTITRNGSPITQFESITNGVDFRALFIRRKDYITSGVTYTPQFSATLGVWQTSAATPEVLADDGTWQVCSVPYPFFVSGKKARFFRVGVSLP